MQQSGQTVLHKQHPWQAPVSSNSTKYAPILLTFALFLITPRGQNVTQRKHPLHFSF
jgi:hypothetical protein